MHVRGFRACCHAWKGRERFRIIVVLIVSGIQHALQYYIIKQTVGPDGDVQLEVRGLCSNEYTDRAYGLKCEQISLLPLLPPENR